MPSLLVLTQTRVNYQGSSHLKQNRTEKIDTRDLGTKWLLYLNFVFCLIISFLCISQKAPFCIRELTLPAYFAKIGMLIIAVGICIRIKAVLTLKKAFTLNVQISKEQQLITNGMYKFVRHPAYTGSILSLLARVQIPPSPFFLEKRK